MSSASGDTQPAMADPTRDTACEQIIRSAKSLKLRIVAFSIAAALVTAFLIVELLIAQRESALERARFEAANLSAGFEDEVRQIITNVSAAMDRIKKDVETRDAMSALQDWRVNPGVGVIPAEFTVTGPDGMILASTIARQSHKMNLSDRDYFTTLAREPARALFIGKLILGRTTGRIKIPLAVRISRPDGGDQADPIDGVYRIFHWRKVRGYPLLAMAGIGKSEALADANRLAMLILGIGAAALILAFLMPLMMVREISKRMTNEIGLSRQREKLARLNRNLAAGRQNLRESNKALQEAQRIAELASEAKSRFLMNMSHEFRTPMHAILNYTSMCLKSSAGDPKIYKYIENTRAAGQRLLGLLNGLLDLTKLEEGQVELHVESLDMKEVLNAAQVELGSLLEGKNIRNTLKVDMDCTFVTADKGRIAQIIVNLFSNAIKFSPENGIIEVVLSEVELAGGKPGLKLTMLDEGPGIPANELAKIFDRFSQSSITKAVMGGAGLGLTICRELVALHGGRIWAENRAAGGASISFVIPKAGPFGQGLSANGTAERAHLLLRTN